MFFALELEDHEGSGCVPILRSLRKIDLKAMKLGDREQLWYPEVFVYLCKNKQVLDQHFCRLLLTDVVVRHQTPPTGREHPSVAVQSRFGNEPWSDGRLISKQPTTMRLSAE